MSRGRAVGRGVIGIDVLGVSWWQLLDYERWVASWCRAGSAVLMEMILWTCDVVGAA